MVFSLGKYIPREQRTLCSLKLWKLCLERSRCLKIIHHMTKVCTESESVKRPASQSCLQGQKVQAGEVPGSPGSGMPSSEAGSIGCAKLVGCPTFPCKLQIRGRARILGECAGKWSRARFSSAASSRAHPRPLGTPTCR